MKPHVARFEGVEAKDRRVEAVIDVEAGPLLYDVYRRAGEKRVGIATLILFERLEMFGMKWLLVARSEESMTKRARGEVWGSFQGSLRGVHAKGYRPFIPRLVNG